MKKNLLNLSLLLITSFAFSQTKENPWTLELGINAVDVYPVGENTPQGNYFDEFFNWTDHWNIGIPTVKVSRYLAKNLSLSARASYNKLSKWGETSTMPSAQVNKLEYYSLDGMVNYSLSNLFNTTKLEPFIAVGGGYTWIQEGTYNTLSTASGTNNLVGAGTVNGSLGIRYWATENLGFGLETTYKHSFEDYLVKHWQHSFGVTFKFGKFTKEEPVEEEPVNNDNDGDGVPNEFDLCPNQSGSKEFGGCPDSDNDGIPDNLDKCPNVKGDNGGGCPTPVKEPVVSETVKDNSKTIYFDYNSTTLDNNARVILDDIAKASKAGTSYIINVNGHTDNVGSDIYNQTLSEKRANKIQEYLVSKGLHSNAIKVEGKGENQPVSDNNSKEGRALNRRSELTITITSK
ncbi:OmpA family protein [Aestuariivivens insulae]|uniref:OmpA family protein n=1 Tax=Aestuariivivens insulae TaxID=1621988 RepID=UPI001F55E7EE|nr:OmpA family protein [Aestuariivivens insulae]